MHKATDNTEAWKPKQMVATTARPSTEKCTVLTLKNITVTQRSRTTSIQYKPLTYVLFLYRNYAHFVLKVILRHGTKSQFSSSLLLHSNSQLANLLSSPAKNASWGSTPIGFTVFGRMKQGTQEDAVESPLCCMSLRSRQCHITEHPIWCQDSQHSLVFIWRTLILAIHHKASRKLPCRSPICLKRRV